MKHALSWIAPAYERVGRTSSFSLERLQAQKVHNVHNSSIGTPRSVCACAQPAMDRSTVKLMKTGLFMTYPTIHTFIIYLQKIPLDTTYFQTQKYKTPYHATYVIFSVSPSYIFTHLEKIQHLTAASESDQQSER